MAWKFKTKTSKEVKKLLVCMRQICQDEAKQFCKFNCSPPNIT